MKVSNLDVLGLLGWELFLEQSIHIGFGFEKLFIK